MRPDRIEYTPHHGEAQRALTLALSPRGRGARGTDHASPRAASTAGRGCGVKRGG